MIPAHNEEINIAKTIESVLSQTRPPDLIVVIANGCTDKTVKIAKKYKVKVLDLSSLKHRKAEALNIGWKKYCKDACIVVCMDADTTLARNALQDWERELTDKTLAGSSSKFTILNPKGILARLQKAEYSAWIDISLKKKTTHVLSGTGCALRNSALKEIAFKDGPWSYVSQVEDFELTYRLKNAGFRVQVSPTVRAFTDSMLTIKSLWRQRMKWQVGTLEDLLSFGFNKFTRGMWLSQLMNLVGLLLTILWAVITTITVYIGYWKWNPYWLALPVLVSLLNLKNALRIPFRDKKDIMLALSVIPNELYVLSRQILAITAWKEVILSRVTKKRKDRWAIQYKKEE